MPATEHLHKSYLLVRTSLEVLQNNIGYYYCSYFPTATRQKDSICKNTTHVGYRTQKKKSWTEQALYWWLDFKAPEEAM